MSDRSSVPSRILGACSTPLGLGDSLENLNTTTLDDGALCYVTSLHGHFELHRDSTATPNGTTVVMPIAGPGRWIILGSGGAQLAFVTPNLTTLAALAGYPNGSTVFVIDQQEYYQLDTTNAFALSSPLIIASASGGRWFRKSKVYVVGNFTLWAAPFGGPFGTGESVLVGFTPGQLLVSAALVPDIVLDLNASIDPATQSVESVTVDNLGNPWVFSNSGSGGDVGVNAYKFLLNDCLASGAPVPSVVVTTVAPVETEGFNGIFDKQNNLWINVGGHGGVNPFVAFRFNQSSYALTTSKAPDLVVSCIPGAGGSAAPHGTSTVGMMAFDGGGNLWFAIGITNQANGGLGMLSASQLQTAATNVVPAVEWTGSNFNGPGVNALEGLCFGPDGLLWTTNFSGSNIRAWDPRNPAASGNPAAAIILTSAIINGPNGLVFDRSGNLWVTNEHDNLIYRIPKASLAASGPVVPDVVLNASALGAFGSSITFPNNPDQSGLLPSGSPLTL